MCIKFTASIEYNIAVSMSFLNINQLSNSKLIRNLRVMSSSEFPFVGILFFWFFPNQAIPKLDQNVPFDVSVTIVVL